MAALALQDAFETQCLQNQRQGGQPGIPSPDDLHKVGNCLPGIGLEQLRVPPGHDMSETAFLASAFTALTTSTLVCNLSCKEYI